MVLFAGLTLVPLLQLWQYLSGWKPGATVQNPLHGIPDAPFVRLDHATVTGVRNGSLEYFLGIPYAQPPVGDLRLRLPQLVQSYDGTLNATTYGHPCLSQPMELVPTIPPAVMAGLLPFFQAMGLSADVTESEDCLNLNIVRPANVSADAKLPVLFWIHGGAFVSGSNAMSLYNGTRFVEKSVELGEPVIFVAVNYRLFVMGFLGGNEMKDAGLGNLGLQDQRTGLRWVNKFISAFGGDPSKVTIWGESAGSISVFFQLYANGGDTEGLFRAGIMSSGFSVPTKDITTVQGTYDLVVDKVGCSNATDTLACLRTVPAKSLVKAANADPAGVISFFPREDGAFISMPPTQLPAQGTVADVPMITGDVKDEGTWFAFSNLNVTTDDDFANFLNSFFYPGSSLSDISTVLKLYPSDPAEGSPFDTGDENAFTPQFKRIAAAYGDWFFQGPRRLLLDSVSAKRTMYNFLSARGNYPGMGHFHGSDLLNALEGGDMTDYFVRFINHLDPNSHAKDNVHWPQYDSEARLTLLFDEGREPLHVAVDDYRAAGMQELNALAMRFQF